MGSLRLKSRIQRLERQARIRRRWEAVYAEIARREAEGRLRVADWRSRQQTEAKHAA